MKFVVAAPEELVELVRSAISDAIACEPHRPALLTTDELARELQISVSSLRTLRQRGLPTLQVLGSPRFELEAVMAWLRTQGPVTPTDGGRRLRQPKASPENGPNPCDVDAESSSRIVQAPGKH